MQNLDVIILSYARDEAHFEMVKKCALSYLKDGEQYINKIILVESNKDFDVTRWKNISDKVFYISPPFKFNYNRFLNIGLKYCDSEFVCVSNSDVVVQENCVGNILKEFQKDPELMSASPVDRTWHRNSYNDFPEDNSIYYGYETTKYLLGFNIYCRRSVYDIIGWYDERFDFYHQDNDYETCLKVNKLKHAMVTSAHIVHGKDKPDDGVTTAETHSKLNHSAGLFMNKWRNAPFNKKFEKYVKLAIVTDTPINYYSNFVKFFPKGSDAVYGQYIFDCNMELTEDIVNKIINKINELDPTKIEIDANNFVVRSF